jgi:crotonobetainyl-CoA:carnitine CoA-transferase CaiB-like acyl-CoA transferase
MKPLSGIKVLDLSRVLAGPLCTLILADLGAEVVKVEPPWGDETRGWGPPFLEGESAYFLSVNRGKRSLALDLKTQEGQEVVRRLAREADILVENFKTGDLKRYGLDYESLKSPKPQAHLPLHHRLRPHGAQGPGARLRRRHPGLHRHHVGDRGTGGPPHEGGRGLD